MRQIIPRIVFAGTSSGCGKTTVTCAVLKALVNRGLKAGAFKCGPDYIDPMFHRRIIGARSANLDLFFFDGNTARALLARGSEGCDVSVIEGVMGFYDGMGLTSIQGSTYEVAQATESPVVLVVDAKGASLSVLAVIQGFAAMIEDNGICGVILNQCAPATYSALEKEIYKRFERKILPLGYFPKTPDCAFESRHLGLITADEIADLNDKLARLAAQAEKTIKIDAILGLAKQAKPIDYAELPFRRFPERVRIGVARDRAFCFYYEDSLDVLREMGAELVGFSPLEDAALPDDLHGLYLGGGYPELYAQELSANESMRASVGRALENGMPCIAECGGFMYLTEAIGEYPMAGYLKGRCFDTGRLSRFGYVTLRAKRDCMLCKAGETIGGHEFHHWDCEHNGGDFTAEKASGKNGTACMQTDICMRASPIFTSAPIPALRKHSIKHV